MASHAAVRHAWMGLSMAFDGFVVRGMANVQSQIIHGGLEDGRQSPENAAGTGGPSPSERLVLFPGAGWMLVRNMLR
jgi:hypothetical protein